MAHSSEMRWAQASSEVSQAALEILEGLDRAERLYQELLEVYNFAGGTDQDFADLLFTDDIKNRTVPGTQAVITVDVVGGAVENPVVTEAGSGYENGTGFTMALTTTAGGGDGLAELTYDVVDGAITNVTVSAAGSTYTNGLAENVTDVPAPTLQVIDTQANTEEVGKATDLRLAITSLNDLYGAMNNAVISQADRAVLLRRMS